MRPRPKPALAPCDVFEFEGCLLVIPRRDPRLFLLNPVARTIWRDIARGALPNEIADRLAARFEVPLARVRTDIESILTEWRAYKLMAGAVDERSPSDALSIDRAEPRAGAAGRAALGRRFHAERVYTVCERPIRLRLETPEIEEVVHPPLAHVAVRGIEPCAAIDVLEDPPGYLVVCNGSDVEPAATLEDALGQVFGRILELSYPDAEWLAMMHAAAVGDERGAAVLVGDSGSGKSTLTAALVHDAGLRYFSDDVVPLDRSWRIRPLPLGVSLKRGSWPVLTSRFPELAGLAIHRGLPRRYLPISRDRVGSGRGLAVACIVFPNYCPDRSTQVWRLPALSVLERLTRVRSWLSLDGRRFRTTLGGLKKTPAYGLRHATLEDGVRVIRSLISGEGVPSDLRRST